MSLQTYTIELKVDATDEGHAAMTEVMKQYTRDLLASAMLLSLQGKHPLVACRTQDNFYETKEIEAIEPSEYIFNPADR